MQDAIIFNPLTIDNNYIRPTLVCPSISDLHFGAINPRVQYSIYHEQIVLPLSKIHFDILFINGDTFDHKCMSNSEIAKYTLMLMCEFVELCRNNDATLIILSGTLSHDANQLKMFYQYMTIPDVDVRIIETLSFQYIKGARVLCIPELYDFPENIYNEYLFNMGIYDMAIMHGTYNGASYNTANTKTFYAEDFRMCKGPVLAGHIHTPGCYDGFVYYSGTPLRYEFGQEEEKGFYILLYNLQTGKYYIQMQIVKSFRYDTVYINDLISNDPKDIIQYIDNLQNTQGIDNLRVSFNIPISEDMSSVINNYYRNRHNIKIQYNHDKKLEKIKNNIIGDLNKFSKYEYVLDKKNSSPYSILSRFINEQEGYTFITPEELKNELENEL